MIHLPPPMSGVEFKDHVRDLTRPPSKFGRLRWRDLDKPGPEHEYIIDGFLSVGDKSIIGGPSTSGKSFLAIHAGMSVAYATIDPEWTFFGHAVLMPGLVIYQAGEGARGVKKRLRAFRRHFSIPAKVNLPFELLQSAVDLYSAEGDTSALIAEIQTIREDYPDLPLATIFIDTLATATAGADENSGKDMSAVMKNIDKIKAATGANICLVHHLNAAGTKLRGHSSVFANVDQVIQVTKSETTTVRKVTLGKQKDDDDSLSISFDLMQVETGGFRKADGKAETSCVCVKVGEKEAIRKAEDARGFNLVKAEERRIFSALLKAADRFGRLATPEDEKFGAPSGARVVHYNEWREAYAEMNPDEQGEKPSTKTIGQRFRQNHEALVRFKVMGLSTPWMWWSGKPVRQFQETQRPSQSDAFNGQSGANNEPMTGLDQF
jgi:hypothetical protein